MTRPRLARVQIDCSDPESLATFWCQLLGFEESGRLGSPPQYLAIRGGEGDLRLCFQRVPESKVGKNRLHLDLDVADIDAITARVLELGGGRVENGDHSEHGVRWRLLLDPEGNEFCVEVGPDA